MDGRAGGQCCRYSVAASILRSSVVRGLRWGSKARRAKGRISLLTHTKVLKKTSSRASERASGKTYRIASFTPLELSWDSDFLSSLSMGPVQLSFLSSQIERKGRITPAGRLSPCRCTHVSVSGLGSGVTVSSRLASSVSHQFVFRQGNAAHVRQIKAGFQATCRIG